MKAVLFTVTLAAVVALAAPATAATPTGFAAVMPHYAAIHAALAGDSIKDVANHAKAIELAVGVLAAEFDATKAGVEKDQAGECRQLLPEISKAAAKLAAATNLKTARSAFGELSRPMVRWREMATGNKPLVVYCPMAKKPWLQESDQIANPYFGSKMLKCGKIVSSSRGAHN